MSILPLLLVTSLLMTFASMAQDLRWTNKGQVRVKRQSSEPEPEPEPVTEPEPDLDPDMEEMALTLEGLVYKGEIKLEKQEEEWLPTIEGRMQQYATPSKHIERTLKEAVRICQGLGGRLWDKDPQQALGFGEIEYGESYWILSDDGSMAEYTTEDIPESIFDTYCTTVSIEESNRKIEVETVTPLNVTKKGCSDDGLTGLTLCLRPVKTYTHANDPNYRKDQRETKTLIPIQKGRAIERLQNIKEELTENDFQSSTARTKIIEKLQTIGTNIETIKGEDLQPFPNFRKIKTDWKDIMTQLQDLEGISTRLHHEKQIKHIEDQLAIDRGNRATEGQKWDTKWTNMIKKVEDNKNDIKLSIRRGRDHTTREPSSEEEADEENEEDQTTNKMFDFLQKVWEELKTKTRSYSEFCSEWQLDCGIIVGTSVTMIIVGIATTITVIKLRNKTQDLTKRVHRIYEYMDLKATKEEQEENDGEWTTKITQNQNNTHNNYTANPTRNKAQIKENYTKLNRRLNTAEDIMLDHGINIKEKKNLHERQRDPNLLYREQGATSPLLGQ